jgi:hypothetical protein
MSEYYMNPFDFVPLPSGGPKEVPISLLDKARYDGSIEYSLETRTPVHISGKIDKSKNGSFYFQRHFLREGSGLVIPGSSIRGMLRSYVEALTGSDFGAVTIGDEKENYSIEDSPNETPYGKKEKTRHIGFKIQGENHPNWNNRMNLFYKKGAVKYECNNTVPQGFSRSLGYDSASFLFGCVSKENEANAKSGRLDFDDIQIDSSKIRLINAKALDVDGNAAMGAPNPSASTAWYFTPGEVRTRRVRPHGGKEFDAWEVIADKVRGRKFYFHQNALECFNHYNVYWNRNNSDSDVGFMPLKPYQVESIAPRQVVPCGKIFFRDLPLTLIKLLLNAIELDETKAHKLGALKPFGFGSVKLAVNGVNFRLHTQFLDKPQTDRTIIDQEDISSLIDIRAKNWLDKINMLPSKENQKAYKFIYPPFNFSARSDDEKGFALVLKTRDYAKPEPESCKKTTMYFDQYQRKATNFETVMGDLEYKHGW